MSNPNSLPNELDDAPVSPLAIEATTASIPRDNYTLEFEYSTQGLGPDNTKIIFRLTRASQNDKELVAKAMAETIMDLNPPGVAVIAGDSPLLRGQWDFVLMYVADILVEPLRYALIKAIESINNA